MYVALASGRVLPSRATSSRLRKVLLPSPAPAQASTAQEDANEKLAHGQPYVLFVDRSDASSRKNPGQQQATVPRAILNMDQAAEEVSEELLPLGVKLIRFQAAGMALAEQFRLVGGARGLIGVHGAGLSHALVLPEGAGLIEILPAKTGIPNRLTSSQESAGTRPGEPPRAESSTFSSQCGFTQFWALAESLGVRYHALVLHRADPDDAFWVPVQPLRRIARAMPPESLPLYKRSSVGRVRVARSGIAAQFTLGPAGFLCRSCRSRPPPASPPLLRAVVGSRSPVQWCKRLPAERLSMVRDLGPRFPMSSRGLSRYSYSTRPPRRRS